MRILALIPGRLARSSPKRLPPNISSRTISSDQRSPTSSIASAVPHASSYQRLLAEFERLVTFSNDIVAFANFLAHHGQAKRFRATDQGELSMSDPDLLIAAEELARSSRARWPGESEEYRRARTALLAEEIELRRQIERVAARRRALPPGGEVTKAYRFEGGDGRIALCRPVRRQDDPGALHLYVRAPARAAVPDVHGVALGMGWRGARHPAARRVRGHRPLADREIAGVQARARVAASAALFGSVAGNSAATITRTPTTAATSPNSSSSRAATGRSACSGPARWATRPPTPGRTRAGAPDLMPLWTILDSTPEGRGADWYPSLTYASLA